MNRRQGGSLSLFWLAIFMALFAALALAALFSMRQERNLFAQAWTAASRSVGKVLGAQKLKEEFKLPGASGLMRRCTIDGKSVISNVDCVVGNPSSKVIELHDSHGFEAIKGPPAAPGGPSPATLQDRMIEKATR